ncbi:HAMP domain-containing protein [Sphingopyxis sp. BSNA05]|uniref:HAMP domain-containing protein n=1 Tax=Sphingopyxis sp. BSNA05 TaxID=1236614 RepID=UPI0015664461|nr:HAMP domain-containing protein [Sphingopyxis sp. BSNA05]
MFAMQLHDSLLVQYRSGGLNRLAVEIEKRLQLSQNRDSVILLILPDGRTIAGNLTFSDEIGRISESWVVRDLYRVGSSKSEPMGITTTSLPGGARLLTGHLLSAGQQLSRINQNAMITAIILAIPISLVIAFLLARMINRRLSKIASITKAIERGDMKSRLPVGKDDGVFDQLSNGINQMLDRLEIVVSELRLMTDGLAHDLRSPVTRLKATIDQALVETTDENAVDTLEKYRSNPNIF